MRLVTSKTVDEVLDKYDEALKISPAFERVTVFSWNDMIMLRDEINRLREQLKPGRVHSCDIPGCMSCGNPEYDEPEEEL